MSLPTQHYPANSAGLLNALNTVEQDAARLGFTSSTQAKLRLVVEELYTNSLRHGQIQPSAQITITLTREQQDLAHLRFEDRGSPHNPFDARHATPPTALAQPVEDRPVGRLGIVLIQGLAVSTTYTRLAAGNRIDVVIDDSTRDGAVHDRTR